MEENGDIKKSALYHMCHVWFARNVNVSNQQN
jgi:hypothetical protein